MKAIVQTEYGTPDLMSLQDVERPVPNKNEVVVKVYASSINSWDYDMVSGKPQLYRLLFGLFKPKYKTIGIDISGVVEALGEGVTRFKVGDEVYGDISDSGFGAFAEFACTREDLLAPKPKNATFEQAAALPHGGVLALQSVVFNGDIKKNQQVLINGAGGSTGPIVLQMAKEKGAVVTCVDTADKVDFLKALGADYFIDYKLQDYTNNGRKYDLIIDLVAHKSVFAYKNSLTDYGAIAIVGGSVGRLIQMAFFGSIISKFTNKKMGLLMHKPGYENLNHLTQLFEASRISAIIDKTFPLNKVPDAVKLLGAGKNKGKLVIQNTQIIAD